MRARTEGPSRGFTLIEAAVALLIVAILAGLLTPLVAQALRRQQEYRTRELMKQAFEALFGARDRRVANCRADFGFDPSASLGNLSVLTSRSGTAWSGVATYGYAGGYLNGYNGPYWTGPVDGSGRPLDGWGRPLQLVSGASGWQVLSLGPDGVYGTGDDLAYPNVAVPYLAFNATVILNMTRTSSNSTGTAVLSWCYGTSPTSLLRCYPTLGVAPAIGAQASLAQAITNAPNPTSLTWNVPSGSMILTLTPTVGQGTFTAVTVVLDLLPGETRSLSVSL